ncbi:MAG: type IV secretory system conjugative DNA transfer family protein [Planctomycetes bacterium]|nr:type IV secretory system conjugative DNA transfer family protein [Planctomycetota bacterium]
MYNNPLTPFFTFAVSIASAYFLTPGLCILFGFEINPLFYFLNFVLTGIFLLIFVYPVTKFLFFPMLKVFGWYRGIRKATKHRENVALRPFKGALLRYGLGITIILSIYYYAIPYTKLLFIYLIPIVFGFIKSEASTPEDFESLESFFLKAVPIGSWVAVIYGGFYISDHTENFRKPFARFINKIRFRRYRFGKGGSAKFGTMIDDWASQYKTGDILLGDSLYEKWTASRWIGHNDDRHIITIAGSRSGKGRSAIIPNLLTWQNSALVIDPKGTNATVTALKRGRGGGRVKDGLKYQKVYVVDPFNIVKDPDIKKEFFNPLSVIDVNSKTVTEDIDYLSDAIILPEVSSKHGDHFRVNAKAIVSGVIGHLLTKNPDATLIDVRKELTKSPEEMDKFFGEMQASEDAGGLPKSAAKVLSSVGPNELGSFFSTVLKNTNWIDSESMQDVLAKSTFKLSDLKDGKTTVYIVIPPDMLVEHKRFMRLFVNLAIREMVKGERSEKPVLFILDEFFSLGPLKQLEEAAGLMGSYNIKLWPIIQNITQLIELYPNNWETFLSNAGMIQVFGLNDLETEKYFSKKLGRISNEVKTSNLRETEELEEEVSRESNRQIIFRSGDIPLLLNRINYDMEFSKGAYSPDPDHKESFSIKRLLKRI